VRWRWHAVLDLLGIDQSPSHSLDEPSAELIGFKVSRDHPLLQQDGRLVSIGPICGYENARHREPPFAGWRRILARRSCQWVKAE
jgi:hypothetical protein